MFGSSIVTPCIGLANRAAAARQFAAAGTVMDQHQRTIEVEDVEWFHAAFDVVAK